MTLQTDLQAAVAQATAASQTLHDIVHGDATSSVATDGGPVKTAAKAIADVETSIQTHMGTLTTHVNAAAASETAAATSSVQANLWAEELENVEVTPGAFSAKHHAAKADAHRIKSSLWSDAPVAQAVEPGRFSAKHWAEQAALAAQVTSVFHGLGIDVSGILQWTSGSAGTFVASDFSDWFLLPQGAVVSLNTQGHLEVTV